MIRRVRMARKRLMVARERWLSAVRRGKQVLQAERTLRAIERRKDRIA
jgi:outer membrane protein TolC